MSLSLKSLVQNSKLLSGFLKPVSKAYAGAAGYRQIGMSEFLYLEISNVQILTCMR